MKLRTTRDEKKEDWARKKKERGQGNGPYGFRILLRGKSDRWDNYTNA